MKRTKTKTIKNAVTVKQRNIGTLKQRNIETVNQPRTEQSRKFLSGNNSFFFINNLKFTKMNKYLKYAAAAIFVATLAINIVVTLDDPFVMLSDEAIATDGDSSTKIVYCRPVDCTGTWTGTADVDGCIPFFGIKLCGWKANITVTYPYSGEKENCTGGDDWYDCNACQSDCVPKTTSTAP